MALSTEPNSSSSKEVPFCTSGTPFNPGFGSSYTVTPTYWAGHFQGGHILGLTDAQYQGIQPNTGKTVIGHELYRQQIPLKESPDDTGPASNVPCRVPFMGETEWTRDIWVGTDGRVEDPQNPIR